MRSHRHRIGGGGSALAAGPFFILLLATGISARAADLHVSKLGDGSDGSSWAKAFKTVQAALSAIPDDHGGHRILVRPDAYMEANLYPAAKGANGAPNILEVDFDGALGSGATGLAILDCGDPEKGLKSVDWWSNFRASPDFSGVGWDRWVIRHVYAAGGDAGLFWDLPPKPEPFTLTVEDSVGIGRAFGGGVANFIARSDEPIVFRRCRLWSLDWWGDAAGAYVRAENKSMPERADITFDDCTLVGPDNALQAGNPGYGGATRVKLKGCRLVALNFSQPRGTPSTGIIYSTIDGALLHVDLEESILMGFKLFGAGKGEVKFSVSGWAEAYVQFEQALPEGIHRLGHWPAEVFGSILPPPRPEPLRALVREPGIVSDLCEVTPIVWKDRLCLMESVRPAAWGGQADYHLRLRDAETGTEIARWGEGYSLASAIVRGETLYCFASRFEKGDWNDVTLLKSADLKNWERAVVIEQEKEHLFNSSVCADADGYVMAYETNDPAYPAFSVKFARSRDLETWTKLPGVVFGTDRYTACPCIRFVSGRYYLMYLEHRTPRWFFETWLARSDNLKDWELAPGNPVLTPMPDEGINASDPDIVEFDGKTLLYYSVGDQRTWMKIKRGAYTGGMQPFFESFFEPKNRAAGSGR